MRESQVCILAVFPGTPLQQSHYFCRYWKNRLHQPYNFSRLPTSLRRTRSNEKPFVSLPSCFGHHPNPFPNSDYACASQSTNVNAPCLPRAPFLWSGTVSISPEERRRSTVESAGFAYEHPAPLMSWPVAQRLEIASLIPRPVRPTNSLSVK